MLDRELTAYANQKRNEYLRKYRREHPDKAYAARLRDAVTFCRKNGYTVTEPEKAPSVDLNGGVSDGK